MKKYRFRSCLTVFLALLLTAALFSGCSAAPAEQEQEPQPMTYAERMALVRQSADSGLTPRLLWAAEWSMEDDRVWVFGNGEDGILLASLTPQATEASVQNIQLPEAEPTAPGQTCLQDLQSLCRLPDGSVRFLLMEQVFDAQPDDGLAALGAPVSTRLFLCLLQADGTLKKEAAFALPQALEEGGQASLIPIKESFGCTAADSAFVAVQLYTLQEDGTGQYAQTVFLTLENGEGRVWPLPDGVLLKTVCALPDGRKLALISQNDPSQPGGRTEQLAWLEAEGASLCLTPCEGCPMAARCECLVSGGQPGALLAWGLNAAVQADPAARTETVLVEDWQTFGIDPLALQAVLPLPEGRLLAVTAGTDENGANCYTLHRLAPCGDALQNVPVLTLGLTGYLDDTVQRLVQEYNFSEPEVYIRTEDYSDAAAAEQGFDSGWQLLQRRLLEGKAPDLLILPQQWNIRQLIRQGAFQDLYPLLDADEQLTRADILPGILAACTENDTLPTIAAAFQVYTAVGSPQTVGDAPGWSLPQYRQLCAQNPQAAAPYYGFSRQDFLLAHLRAADSLFVDDAAGRSHLNEQPFVQLLESSAACPAQRQGVNDDPKQALAQKTSLLRPLVIGSFSNALQLRYEFDGAFVCKGFADECGTTAQPVLRLAVTRDCADPQSAWRFVRSFLLPSFQDTVAADPMLFAFPVRCDSLRQAAAAAQQPVAPASWPSYLTAAQAKTWDTGVTPEECARLQQLIDNVRTLENIDSDVENIILEEAAVFYAGACTAQQAADRMHDRVQTCLQEQAD